MLLLKLKIAFESNVILDRYKTFKSSNKYLFKFESNVILDRYKTPSFLIGVKEGV